METLKSQSDRIVFLERQLDLIKQSAASPGGDLQNQIDGMSLLMEEVATTLKLKGPIRGLPAWAAYIMTKLPSDVSL